MKRKKSSKQLTIDEAAEQTLVSEYGDGDDVAESAEEVEEEAEEEVIDEQPSKKSAKVDTEVETLVLDTDHPDHGSWTFYVVVVVALLFIIDNSAAVLGSQLFWSDRMIVIASFVARSFVLLMATYLMHARIFAKVQTMYIVTAGIGLISGLLIAIIRFLDVPSTPTFLSMLVEPFDSFLIALIVGYIIHHLAHAKLRTAEHG